jgi:flagellar assembly protein FliH
LATIIKRDTLIGAPSTPEVRGVAFNFQELWGQAEDYLQQVRNEAAKIVTQAHAEAAQVRRQAEQAGREAAQKAIEKILDEKVAKQMATLKPALEAVASQLVDARGEWLDAWEQGSVRLAICMAEKILHAELSRNPMACAPVVREALELAVGAADITLHLNPEDFEHLRKESSTICQWLQRLAPTQVVSDPSITRGGCRVTTRFGEVDQRLETQLARIEQELTA